MEKQRDLDRLLSDLQSFLLVLDGENLTLVAKAKKESIADLLMQLQNPLAEDAEYMTMNCISTSGGHRNQRETGPRSARKGGNLSNSGEKETFQGIPAPRSWHPLHLPPPEVPRAKKVLPSHLQRQTGDDCYEEAEPLSPRGHSNTGSADTDSSHYESYGEEEDCVKDRAHYIQWSPGASISDGPARPESQICGFLWRKKWLGQWAKQLFIIREHLLLCYKCARDLQPLLQLDLRGCRVAYKPKHSKKMQHELKISSSSETLVMGFQSRQQAEEWRKVIEEVSSSTLWGSPPTPGMDRSKHSPQVKSAARCSELDQGHGQLQPPAAPRKPGPLNVLLNCRWQSFWCSVERDVLRMFRDSGCADTPEHSVPLRGCHVTTSTGPNMGQRYGIGIAKHGKDIAVLETCSEDERDVWLKLLQAGSDRDHESEAVSVYEGTNGETSSSGDATSPASVGALLLRKFPTPNAYMDDPFGQIPAPASPDPVYFNADIPQFVSFNGVGQQGSPRRPSGLCPGSPQELQMSNTTIPASEICNAPKSNLAKSRSDYQMQSRSPPLREKAFFGSHQTLVPSETQGAADGMVLPIGKRSFPRPQEKAAEPERACRMRTQLKAGSEMNLLAIGRSSAQASCDYVAMNVHSAGSEGAYPVPVPVLKRASSAKGTLKRAPSVVVIEKGRVLQKRKEWEMKASA